MISNKGTRSASKDTNRSKHAIVFLPPNMNYSLISSPRTPTPTVVSGPLFEESYGQNGCRVNVMTQELDPLDRNEAGPCCAPTFPYIFPIHSHGIRCQPSCMSNRTGYNSTFSIVESALAICKSRNVTSGRKHNSQPEYKGKVCKQ